VSAGGGFAIRAFVGANGGGKSLAMVEAMVLPAWQVGRKVVANMSLFPERLGFSPDLYEPLESWRQIPDLMNTTLLLDEISSVLPSRQAMSVPPQLVRVLNQLRKGDVQLGWTAPNWARCDVLLREVTQAVTVCRGSWPDRWLRAAVEPAKWNRPAVVDRDGHKVRHDSGWGPNRYFTWRTYDAMEFDEFSYSAVKDIRPRRVRHYWRPRHNADLVYDTLDAVSLLDHLDDVGLCVSCGGTRSRPRCTCGTSPDRPGGRKAEGRVPDGPAPKAPGLLDDRDPLGPVRPLVSPRGRR
jgi:hypothetical protein